MHDFDKLWNRTHDHEAKLCAFDLLELLLLLSLSGRAVETPVNFYFVGCVHSILLGSSEHAYQVWTALA